MRWHLLTKQIEKIMNTTRAKVLHEAMLIRNEHTRRTWENTSLQTVLAEATEIRQQVVNINGQERNGLEEGVTMQLQ